MNKFAIALVLATAVFFTVEACISQKADNKSARSIDGTWVVVSVSGSLIDDPAMMPIITIDQDGQVQGTLGCNTLSATAKLDKSNSTVKFESIGVTKKLCRNMEVENELVKNLSKIVKYTAEDLNEDALMLVNLMDKDERVIVQAKKLGDNTSSEAMKVLHGEWVIFSLGTDTLLQEVTLPFIVDPSSESVSGHTGYNSFGGTIVFSGSHGVSFPAIATTQALGDDTQNERESALMKALNSTTGWSEDANGRVHFTDSLGNTLFIIER